MAGGLVVGQLVLSFFLLLSLSLRTRARGESDLVGSGVRTSSLASIQPDTFGETVGGFVGFDSFSALCVDPGQCGCTLVTARFDGFRCCSIDDSLPRPRGLDFSPGPRGGVKLCFN